MDPVGPRVRGAVSATAVEGRAGIRRSDRCARAAAGSHDALGPPDGSGAVVGLRGSRSGAVAR